ncbi:Smr/MutS family protein [Allochromatium humboldtianum]|uniref:Smr/MutS family protein n=1 Tax=Allochromatium humboldtianum TaxID=504901 RepID=A0A850R510_9GAMM|nr:Smr/MutS family protein [Allochromatium humboldtianum]NVZ07885.1 Smr/MutS family protein [Allochromatium humboldtianum]
MKPTLQDADRQLFREQVEDAEPLSFESTEPFRRRPPPVPRPRPIEAPEGDERVALAESEVETHDYLFFARPGVQNRVLADLQRGAFPVGLEVDLHGLQAEHARQILAEFLTECAHRRVRCARIIHGKGYRSSGRAPVLKSKVNYWLRLYDQVLAFCSATRRDGGTGAVYVLLRNPNKASRARMD